MKVKPKLLIFRVQFNNLPERVAPLWRCGAVGLRHV